MRALEHALVCGQRHAGFEQPLAILLAGVELAREFPYVGELEVVPRLLHFVLVGDVPIGDLPQRTVGPHEVEETLDALQIHRKTFEAVGDLTHHWPAVEAANLLEIRELRDLHAVQPHLPAEAPCTERRRFPVVLDEPHVVDARVDTHRRERSQVEVDEIRWRRLDHHLVLVVPLHAKRVLAVAPIGRATRGLNVRGAPRLRADGPQERGRVERARTHLHVVGLQQRAALPGPVLLEREDQVLEGPRRLGSVFRHRMGQARGAGEYSRADDDRP